jgi:hypothetical protein
MKSVERRFGATGPFVGNAEYTFVGSSTPGFLLGWAAIAIATLLVGTAPEVSAQQFRIETEVFDDSQQVMARSLTLFDGSIVYDFLMTTTTSETPRSPSGEGTTDDQSTVGQSGSGQSSAVAVRFRVEEVVVMDHARQRITLLDQQQRHKFEIGHAELLSMVASMQASEALRARDSFLLEPKLTESFDPPTGELELASPRLGYRAQGQVATDPQVVAQYYLFADWAARLNATDSRKLPPFARLQLNQAMKRRGWLPTQVHLELTTLTDQRLQATAKHHTLLQLSANDRQRIESVQKQLNDFPAVSLTRYRHLTTAGNF